MRLLNYSPASADARNFWQRQLNQPHLYARDSEFKELIRQTAEGLQQLCSTQAKVMFMTAAGTGALECAIAALPVNKRILVIRNGYFGDRLYQIAKFHFSDVHSFDLCFGKPLRADHEAALKSAAVSFKADAIIAAHLETSSTVVNDVSVVGKVARQVNAISIIDAISSIGCVDIKMTEWNIDCVVASAYKALLCPAGLSFIIADQSYLAQAHWTWSYYFEMSRLLSTAEAYSYLWSPNVLIQYCLKHVLDSLLETGKDRYFIRLQQKAESFRRALTDQGLKIFGSPDRLSPCFTALELAEDHADLWVSRLKQDYGIILGKGLGYNVDRTLRIGHYPNRSEKGLIALATALGEVRGAVR
ncbi:MAG: aminotransferase class V-fold PLP-dependent enzyme [bacterium]|nr:aminotransferase class V-fold PLP-dependent enzyme [bacterium]